MSVSKQELLRQLPAVSKFLISEHGLPLVEKFGANVTKLLLTDYLDALRKKILDEGFQAIPQSAKIAEDIKSSLQRLCLPEARKAINATGIILHTALGRAPFSQAAHEAVAASTGYCIVQVDPETNLRSRRDEKIEAMLQELTGCQSATTLTNNAAATFLLLHVMAAGREIILSRGQLVEIGGEFRMPDVIERSGVIMREVGTTNRTHLKDYEAAINEKTAALLYVHPSNYHVQGFASTPSIEELCRLGDKYRIPVIADLGSGALVKMSKYGVKDAITIREALEVGSAVTCSSGDKLICGPQAGIVCGNTEVVEKVRKSPYARMFRTDKMVLAALEATLLEFVRGDIETTVPLYSMLATPLSELEQRADKIAAALKGSPALIVKIEDTPAFVGGGSLPTEEIPSKSISIALRNQTPGRTIGELAKQLRLEIPPVFCRISDEKLVFDMRTLLKGDVERLIPVLRSVLCASF